MKRLWMTGVVAGGGLALALGAPVLAQPGNAKTKSEARQASEPQRTLADALGLTPDQRAQVRPILADMTQQVKAVRADATLSPADKKTKVRAVRQAARQKVLALLTPDQKKKLAALRQHQKTASGA